MRERERERERKLSYAPVVYSTSLTSMWSHACGIHMLMRDALRKISIRNIVISEGDDVKQKNKGEWGIHVKIIEG